MVETNSAKLYSIHAGSSNIDSHKMVTNKLPKSFKLSSVLVILSSSYERRKKTVQIVQNY